MGGGGHHHHGSTTTSTAVDSAYLFVGIVGGLVLICGVVLNKYGRNTALMHLSLRGRLRNIAPLKDLVLSEWALLLAYVVGCAGFVAIKYQSLHAGGVGSTRALAKSFGSIAIINLAAVILPISRTSVFGVLFGTSFERMLIFHKILGRGVIVLLFLHLVLLLLSSPVPNLATAAGPHPPLFGFLSFLSFLLMGLSSLAVVRRKFFEVFSMMHHVLFVLGVSFGVVHARSLALTGMVPFLLYAVDRCVRIYYGRFVKTNSASVKYIEDPALTILKFRKQFVFQPGQYVFVNVPQLSRFEWHPFSLASAPGSEECMLCIRSAGPNTWTGRLHALSATPAALGPVLFDRPMGKLSVNNLDSYDVVFLLAGGIGITPIASIALHLASANPGSAPRLPSQLKRVVLVWAFRRPGLLPVFQYVMDATARAPDLFSAHLHSTSVAQPLVPLTSNAAGDMEKEADARPQLWPRRPVFSNVFDSELQKCEAKSPRVAVVTCGPESMCQSALEEAQTRGWHAHREMFLF